MSQVVCPKLNCLCIRGLNKLSKSSVISLLSSQPHTLRDLSSNDALFRALGFSPHPRSSLLENTLQLSLELTESSIFEFSPSSPLPSFAFIADSTTSSIAISFSHSSTLYALCLSNLPQNLFQNTPQSSHFHSSILSHAFHIQSLRPTTSFNSSSTLQFLTAHQLPPTTEFHCSSHSVSTSDQLQQLISGQISTLVWIQGRRLSSRVDTSRWTLLSGSYNPLHSGHKQLARVATHFSHAESSVVAYELSVVNADKAPLVHVSELEKRVLQFTSGDYPLVLTREALFVDKARVTRGSHFVVGVDTAARILDKKYYGNDERSMISVLRGVHTEYGVKVLVAGRVENPQSGQGQFITLRNLEVPAELQCMFCEIPEDVFRSDISSTMIRNANKV